MDMAGGWEGGVQTHKFDRHILFPLLCTLEVHKKSKKTFIVFCLTITRLLVVVAAFERIRSF